MYIYFFTLLLCSLPCFASDNHTIQPVPALSPIKQDSIRLKILVFTLHTIDSDPIPVTKAITIHDILTNTKLTDLANFLNQYSGKGDLMFNCPNLTIQKRDWVSVLDVYNNDTLETLKAKNLIPDYADMNFNFYVSRKS